MIHIDTVNIHLASMDAIDKSLAVLSTHLFINFRTPIMNMLEKIIAAQAQNRVYSAAETAEVAAKINALLAGNAALQTGMAALQAQIANGAGVTEAQLTEVLAGVVAEGDAIRGIFTPDAEPVADPVADPVAEPVPTVPGDV